MAGVRSVGDGVPVAMRDPPLTLLATVNLSGPQAVGARLPVYGSRDVLEAGCVGHVPDDVGRDQFECVGRAVREAAGEGREELVELLLTARVAPRSQDADRLVARPERAAGSGF